MKPIKFKKKNYLGEQSIKSEVLNFFSSKFDDPLTNRSYLQSARFKQIPNEDRNFLEREFYMEELKSMVWSCGNNKSSVHMILLSNLLL